MLEQSEIKSYWKKRAEKLQSAAVGFGDLTLDKQDKIYEEVKKFIYPKMLNSVLTMEYGCGIGRHAGFFENYIGVDITDELIAVARRKYPYFNFYSIGTHLPNGFHQTIQKLGPIQQVFTATVLQHCSDNSVLKILESFAENIKNNFRLCMYENSEDFKKPHVVGRAPNDYVDLVKESGLKIKNGSAIESHTHSVKNERHTLTVVMVENEG